MLCALLVLAAGCGPGDSTADTGELSGLVDCDAIIEACHDYDMGFGDLSECHDLAHDATSNMVCLPERDRCVALCEAAAMADSGAEHDEDGGAH
ncbi:MAG: hypothetical protein J0L92_26640 [Deltaproteobacteria bacterium]|nr:hypothetical protein [Deltaproteobacteria bacterium]